MDQVGPTTKIYFKEELVTMRIQDAGLDLNGAEVDFSHENLLFIRMGNGTTFMVPYKEIGFVRTDVLIEEH